MEVEDYRLPEITRTRHYSITGRPFKAAYDACFETFSAMNSTKFLHIILSTLFVLSEISIDNCSHFYLFLIGKVQNAMFQTDNNALEENHRTQSPLSPFSKVQLNEKHLHVTFDMNELDMQATAVVQMFQKKNSTACKPKQFRSFSRRTKTLKKQRKKQKSNEILDGLPLVLKT